MKKKILAIALTLTLAMSVSACSSDADSVNVQRADQLSAAGQAAERFAGMVVSENVVEIKRDSEKSILELYVSEGQKVSAGQKLFSYDSAALEIDLEKQQLEVTKMTEEQSSYNSQLNTLQNQLNQTSDTSARTRIMIEINTLKTKLMEIKYQMAAKEKEVENLKKMLANIDITSPVEGTVRKIDEKGETPTYITIQQSNAYKVKGMLNEMSMNSNLAVDSKVKIVSRIDSNVTWTGTVTNIDWNNTSQESENSFNSNAMDSMTTSSAYPFYVELDNPDGLLLGQHVYIEVLSNAGVAGLWIPETYLSDIRTNDNGETTAKIWVANRSGKLEQRSITLGIKDDFTGCLEVITGLMDDDYVADPNAPGCKKGAKVLYRNGSDFTPDLPEPSEDNSSVTQPDDFITDDFVPDDASPEMEPSMNSHDNLTDTDLSNTQLPAEEMPNAAGNDAPVAADQPEPREE